MDFHHADAFEFLRQAQQARRRWDVVVVDPSKFVPRRSAMELGLRKYSDLNRLAAGVVAPGGILLTCSCSGLVDQPTFVDTVGRAARAAGRTMQIFRLTGAGGDHPILADTPEGQYLKAVWCAWIEMTAAGRGELALSSHRADRKGTIMEPTSRFELLRPRQLDQILAAAPVAMFAFGSLEWHGRHLPVGLDAIKAHELLLGLAKRTGGVVLPPFFVGTGGGHYGYPYTIMSDRAYIQPLMENAFRRMCQFGFRVQVAITGHYPPEQVEISTRRPKRRGRPARA